MKRKLRLAAAAATLAVCLVANGALAQSYPAKPVNFITSVSGGVTEAIMRDVLENMHKSTGQPFLFDARPAAGGAVALQALKAAPPDGYTLGYLRQRVHAEPARQSRTEPRPAARFHPHRQHDGRR